MSELKIICEHSIVFLDDGHNRIIFDGKFDKDIEEKVASSVKDWLYGGILRH